MFAIHLVFTNSINTTMLINMRKSLFGVILSCKLSRQLLFIGLMSMRERTSYCYHHVRVS